MAEQEQTKVKDSGGTFDELKTMVTAYAKQQTVEPLKNLGQWAAFGLAGAICLTIGAFLTGLGALRLFQKMDWTQCEVDIATGVCEGGGWSFAPYMFVFALLIAVAGACFWAMTKTPEWMDDDA